MVAYLNAYLNSMQCTSSTTNQIWNGWVNISSATTATNTVTSNTVWCSWNTTNTITTSATTDVWLMWMDGQGNLYVQGVTPAAQPVQVNEEHLRIAREAQERQAVAYQEAEKQRKVAAAKALELLRANISQKQREALDKHGWFLVEGGKSKKTYRVYGDRSAGNIFELCPDKKKEVMKYCVHASYEIPLGDQLLAQAISLRLDEDHIIGKANRTALAA